MESTKLSFSLASKPSSSRPPKRPASKEELDSTQSHQEFVTEFDPSKTLTHQKPTHFSIPRLENTWNPYKKMKNLDLPMRSSSDDPDLRFEVEAPSTADATDSSMSYGLNLRSRENDSNDSNNDLVEEDRSVVRPSSTENVLLQKFKEDMLILPEDRGMEEFVDVPVEGFGAALLKAYGWSEGKGIGRNAKEDVKVVQYVRRGDKEGLGFVGEAPKQQKGSKSSQSNQVELVAPKGPDGKTRHVVGVDEKLVPRELKGIHVGKIVRIVGGKHFGLKGKVLKKFDGEVVLKLKNDEEVVVGIKDVTELGTVDDENCVEELRNRMSKDHRKKTERRDYRDDEGRSKGRDDRKKDRTRYRDEQRSSTRVEKDGSEARYQSQSQSNSRSYDSRKEEKRGPGSISWLTSHIRVRIISKDFKGGKLYLKKGQVVDVVGPNTCDVSLDESKQLIQGVDQDILETAIPKQGGPVLILYGKYKGVFGHLVQRDMKKETGVVQDADSHELLNVQLEQIAEYIGDPSSIGY